MNSLLEGLFEDHISECLEMLFVVRVVLDRGVALVLGFGFGRLLRLAQVEDVFCLRCSYVGQGSDLVLLVL